MHIEARAKTFRLTLTYTLILAVLVAVYKIVPRYFQLSETAWNLVPIGALALFVGSRLRAWYAYLVPLVAMLVADLAIIPAMAAIGYQSMDASTPFTYVGFVAYVLVGRLIGQNDLSPVNIAGAALWGSVVFFLVSNFGSWVASEVYSRSPAGLWECYALGVPFYRNTMLSDVVFTAGFFGLHAILARGLAPAQVEQPA
ncbi:MAG: DUF6580 family putative transport protein [Gemmataceae bacterium]